MDPPDHSFPAHQRARATRLLVLMNLSTFFLIWWMRAVGVDWVNAAYGMVPARLSADPVGESVKLVTSLFVHDGFTHLLWNLLFLYLFGGKVERRVGTPRFAAFYLLTGVLGAVAQYSLEPQNPIPLVGASGAIAGLLGGLLVVQPNEPVTIFRVPAYRLIGVWFVINMIGGLASLGSNETDTAFFAHLGGFLAGVVLVRPLSWALSTDDDDSPKTGRPYVTHPPIFKRQSDRPFWREED